MASAKRDVFIWEKCLDCKKFADPIYFDGHHYNCKWCGCFFAKQGFKVSQHAKKCCRGPNLGNSDNFVWHEQKCHCEEGKKIKEIMQDYMPIHPVTYQRPYIVKSSDL